MSTLMKIKNNKLIIGILGGIIFILLLPIISIILKSIFTIGEIIGTLTRNCH